MYIKQRQTPLEVSSWMAKDISLRKVTANSRMMTNDTRQNVVLSRRFFTNMFSLSMERYRKITECDHNQKLFLRQQLRKTEVSLPGLRPYVEQQMSRNSSNKNSSSFLRRDPSDLQSSSISSFPLPLESKSDPTFDRNRPSQTAQNVRTSSDVVQTGKSANFQTKFERLAMAKGTRLNPAGTAHIRPRRDHLLARRALIGRLDDEETITSSKINETVDDVRFRSLVGTFAEVHQTNETSKKTVETIVRSNSSLHDPEGRWKTMNNQATIAERAQLKHRRQMLIEQLHKNIDIFLIEVAA